MQRSIFFLGVFGVAVTLAIVEFLHNDVNRNVNGCGSDCPRTGLDNVDDSVDASDIVFHPAIAHPRHEPDLIEGNVVVNLDAQTENRIDGFWWRWEIIFQLMDWALVQESGE